MSSKMDGARARTATDLELKYNFGQSFAEVYGLITDAQKAAEEAVKAVDSLDHEEIFNRLTNYGEIQGIYRENDNIYINASYIKSGILSAEFIDADNLEVDAANIKGTLTANQINMTGAITWGDLSSSVQNSINQGGNLPSYIKSTYIDSTTVMSPTIQGGTLTGGLIYGGSFLDLNGKAMLVLNPSDSASRNADLCLYSGENVAFEIYDEITGSITLKSYDSEFMVTGAWGTSALGEWDFSSATVTGITATFG